MHIRIDKQNSIIGAVAGDIIGSIFEWDNYKFKDFKLFGDDCFFTDDTVCTLALCDSILTGTDYAVILKKYYRLYPDAGYGSRFVRWCESDSMEPYNSWGNGAPMRINPVAHVTKSLDEVMEQSLRYTKVTHDHPEGIRGGQSVAVASFLALHNESKESIKSYIIENFGYDLSSTLDEIRPTYTYDVSSQGTVPVALIAFLESTGYEDAIRNAISVGGDSDTIACITGSISSAFYGVPTEIATKAESYLDDRLLTILKRFEETYL